MIYGIKLKCGCHHRSCECEIDDNEEVENE